MRFAIFGSVGELRLQPQTWLQLAKFEEGTCEEDENEDAEADLRSRYRRHCHRYHAIISMLTCFAFCRLRQ